MEADPHELNNLAGDPACESVRSRLGERLDAWIAETGDLGERPEPAEVAAYWDEHMAEGFRRAMEGRGLTPEISDVDYVAWWEEQLL